MAGDSSRPCGDAGIGSTNASKPVVPSFGRRAMPEWSRRVIASAVVAAAALLLALWVLDTVFNGVLANWFEDTFAPTLWYQDYSDGPRYLKTVFNLELMKMALVASVVLIASFWALAMVRTGRRIDAAAREETAREATAYSEAVLSAGAPLDREVPAHFEQLALVLERERAAREQAARAARDEVERKDDLVAYLAHDLKTPLTSVIGYADMLVEDPDMPRERRSRYAGAIRSKGLRLEELINEFFEIARYNLQHIELSVGRVDLGLLAEQMREEMYPAANRHGNDLAFDVPRGTFVEGDPDKLARAIGNVLRNAVAYSYGGTPIRMGCAADAFGAALSIENEGPTIPQRKLSSIFDRFYRVDSERSSEKGGSGLGLAIAREIVERHGGSIGASSEGERTVFTIRLPCEVPRDPER